MGILEERGEVVGLVSFEGVVTKLDSLMGGGNRPGCSWGGGSGGLLGGGGPLYKKWCFETDE